MGKSTISMAIFNSYVELPEGISGWFTSCIHGIMACPLKHKDLNWFAQQWWWSHAATYPGKFNAQFICNMVFSWGFQILSVYRCIDYSMTACMWRDLVLSWTVQWFFMWTCFFSIQSWSLSEDGGQVQEGQDHAKWQASPMRRRSA